MKKSLLLLALIGCACLLNSCGGSSGSGGGTQSGVATHLAVTAPSTVNIGVFFNLTVTALDATNNVATGTAPFRRSYESFRRNRVFDLCIRLRNLTRQLR